MKAIILTNDIPSTEAPTDAGAVLRYTKVNKKTFFLLTDLLEGYDEVEIYTYVVDDKIMELVEFLSQSKFVKVTTI